MPCTHTLPTELLREIASYYVYSLPQRGEEPGKNCKPAWEDVRPLTLASKTFRHIALELWFEAFFAVSPSQLIDVRPEIRAWTRYVSFQCHSP